MRNRVIAAGAVIVIIVAVVLGILLGGGGGGTPTPGQVDVPVNVTGASKVGSLSFELSYDPSVIDATDVTAGELASNAMMEYNTNSAGRILVGIVDSAGIDGDGAVVTITFGVIGDGGSSPLTLANVAAHDADTLVDIVTVTSAGSFVGAGQSATPPTITFNP